MKDPFKEALDKKKPHANPEARTKALGNAKAKFKAEGPSKSVVEMVKSPNYQEMHKLAKGK
jgi:hypothetical protein